MSQQPSVPLSLVMRRGPQPNQNFSLHKAVLTIGRAVDNDIVVDDAGISRHHARLTRQGDNWVLEDLGSSNGTFVNGQRISGPVTLTPGSQVALGPNILFGVEGATPVPVAPPPSPPKPARPVKKAKRKAWWTVPLILVALLLLVAGLLLVLVWLGGRSRHTPGSGPALRITNLHSGDRVPMERAVLVQSEARDATNSVTQVELWVDGQLQRVDGSQEPKGTPHFFAAQSWQTSSPGSHTVMVRALNSRGAASEAILVVEAVENLVAVGPEGQEVSLDDLNSAAYVASRGETVGDISQSLGVSEGDIVTANPDLSLGQPLDEGQVVVVPFDLGAWVESEEAQRIAALVTYNNYQGNAWATFSVENAGSVAFESLHAVVNCGAERPEVQDDQPFLSRPDNRPPQGSVLQPGGLAYLAIPIGPVGTGTQCEARFTFYSQDGAAGLATGEIVVPFTVEGERLVEPVEPIPPGPLGDIMRLFRRLRRAQAGQGGTAGETPVPIQTYDPGDSGLPVAPSLEVSHEGCDIVVTWCPNSSNELGFYLYRWDTTTGGDFEQIAEFVNPPHDRCHEYREQAPHAGEYYYQMVASNEFGEGVSDIVREQVTASDCPALAHLVESNLMVLEFEALDFEAWGEYYDGVYCYAALDALPEERFPPNDGEFFEAVVGSPGHWNIDQYLSEENSRILTVPADQPLRVWAECYAWAAGQLVPLGEFWNDHPPAEWDGRELTGETGAFQARYRINRVTGVGMIAQDFPDIGCERYPAPYDLGIGSRHDYPTLEWTWDGNVDWIEGFWILYNGEKIQWVDKPFGTIRGEPNRYWDGLDEFLAFPECGGGDLSVVAGMKDEPMASNVCFNSPPSASLSRQGPPCQATVTVRFDTIEFTSMADSGAAVYGYLIVNDQHLGLAIPYYEGATMFRAEEGRTYDLADLAEAPTYLISRAETVPAGEGVIVQYRPSDPEITLTLDHTTPLEVIIDLTEFGFSSDEGLCFSHMYYPPGFTGGYLGETGQQTSGWSPRGECVVHYTLLITGD